MNLLYTGALAPDQPQPQPQQSIGGFVSSSLVMNGTIGNLFSDLSPSDVKNSTTFTRMIALKNTTGVTVNDLEIFTVFASEEYEIKIAGVMPAIDTTCNRVFFEQLQNQNSIPFQSQLEVGDEDNPILLEQFEAGEVLGIWLSLSKKTGSNSSPTPLEICSDEYVEKLRSDLNKFEVMDFLLKINYN